MSRKQFPSDEKMIKNVKNPIFSVFFIIERWFFKGIHRKNKKVKTIFASILTPECVFSKTKIQNNLNHRIQSITKITIFRKIKKSCNTKTLWKQFRKFWFFMCFDSITPLQCHIKKLLKILTKKGIQGAKLLSSDPGRLSPRGRGRKHCYERRSPVC